MDGEQKNERSLSNSLMIEFGGHAFRAWATLVNSLPFILILVSIVFNDAKSIGTEFTNIFIVKVSLFTAGLLLVVHGIFYKKAELRLPLSFGAIIIAIYFLFIAWRNYEGGSDLNVLFERRVTALCFYFFCMFILNRKIDNRALFFSGACSLITLAVLAMTFYELPFADFRTILRPNGITGPFENASHLSTFLTMCLPFFWWRVRESHAGSTRSYYLVLALLTVVVIILCNQRSAWLGLIFVIGYFSVPVEMLRNLLRRPFVACAIVAVVFAVLIGMYLHRPASAQGRLLVAKIAISELNVPTTTGNGIGSLLKDYLNAQARYFSKPRPSSEQLAAGEIYTVYNEYLLAYFESGVIGCLLILIYLLIKLARLLRRGVSSEFARASYCALSVYGIVSLVSYPSYSLPILFMLFLSFAILDVDESIISKKVSVPRLPFLIGVALILIFQIIAQFMFLKAAYRWKNLTIANPTAKSYIFKGYKSILPYFSNNGEFLYEYGKVLIMLNEPKIAQQYLRLAASRFTSVDLYITLGWLSESNHDYKRSEKYYTKAANMVPHRFTAQYWLWKMYKTTGSEAAMRHIERQILNQKIKVSSTGVREMLDEIQTNAANVKPE